MNKIIIGLIALVAVYGAAVGSVALVGGNQSVAPVATSEFGAAGTRFPHGLTVGTGTNLSGVVAGTCNLIGTDASQAGSTTKAYDCAVTGLTSSYAVMAQLSTSTILSTGLGWAITSAKASSTAGYATVYLTNFGSSQIPSVLGIGSSTDVVGFTTQ